MAVFLVSCAAPSGRTYRDGVPVERAPVFVTPGYAPAGAGLPEYMPVNDVPTAPRGTDRRVLPPTREPGIWASDSEPKTKPIPRIGKTLFPSPEVSDAEINPSCIGQVNDLLDSSGKRAKLERLIEPVQHCIAATLYEACIDEGEKDRARVETENRKRYKLPPLKRPKSKQKEDAERISKALCYEGALWGPDVFDVMRPVKEGLSLETRRHQ